MNTLTQCPQVSAETASRIIDQEAVVVIPQEGLVRMLNEVGARIWQLADGRSTVGEIVGTIVKEYDVSTEEAEHDVRNFIKELEQKGMVTLNDESIV